jgi:RNA polymerase sigma factor (sigma-70 family)
MNDPGETSLALHAACTAPSLQDREAGYQELGRLLYLVAWRRVSGNPKLETLAADCMQEALLVVWRCLEDQRGPEHPERFVGWCSAIVLNKLREELRRIEPKTQSRRPKRVAMSKQTSLERSSHPDGRSLAASLADEARSLDEDQSYRELRALMQEIRDIDAISENSRTVLLKGYIEGWDDEELAAHLATSRANVHVIRSRDLAKLRNADGFLDRLRKHSP